MQATYHCVRCGREREEHDTNLVCQTDEFLAEIRAEEVNVGYQMSLLTCTDTPRPETYTNVVLELTGASPPQAIGYGAGYVSPDPQAEIKARQDQNGMVARVTWCLPFGSGGPLVDISG